MTTPQKVKLANIKSEVEEFHPLLEALLHNLPNVVNVEYRHGQDEKGADFVFSQHHPILGNIEYVGVIAKVGKIVQDFSELERQIDECITLHRKFLGGKEVIRISEIWVIVTENITGGAQEKIHEKYKTQRIEFIQSDRLIDLINKHFPVYWSNTTINIGKYLSTLHVKNENEDKALSLWQFADKSFYIEQDLFEFPRLEYRKAMVGKSKLKRPKQVNTFEAIENNKIVLVEGGVGSGKSKLLRHLVDYYSVPEVFISAGLFPISTTYKEIMDRFEGKIELLIQNRISPELKIELQGKKLLILIDAFDEQRIDVNEQLDKLGNLVDDINKLPDVHAIITSRYLYNLDKTNFLEDKITRLHLAPLSLNRTIEFITELCTNLNLTNRLIEDLKKSQLFKELPRSPIVAILLAKLINENPKDLPSSIPELYSKYMELLLGRWEVDKGLQTQKEYQALDSILIKLAECMLDYEMPQITIGDTSNIVRDYLSERNLDLKPESIIDKLENRCDVLLVDSQSRNISFKHRSFAEYFYSKSIVHGKEFNISDRAFDLYWINTIYFYLGILKDCPELITQLTEMEPKTEGGKWLKLINMGSYLLAAYTTPYEKVTDAITKVVREASQLFSDLVEARYESPFLRFSHMTLLFMFQYIIRYCYSFDFFKKAIEDAALNIDYGDDEELVKVYALFFLNVAYIELGGNNNFDFLLKNHSDGLNLDLLLALRQESVDSKERSAIMKKQDKRIRYLLKKNPSLNEQVKRLYDRPIKLLSSGVNQPN